MDFEHLLAELKRRRVYQVIAAYCVVAWLIIQIADLVFPAFDFPAWSLRLVIILSVLVGFGVVMLAWTFDVTARGVTRTPEASTTDASVPRVSRKLTIVMTLIGLGALALFVFQLVNNRSRAAQRHPIAIIPFENLSRDENDAYLASGMSEALAARLQKVSKLTVVSSASTRFFPSSPGIHADAVKQLSVETIVQGSVQKLGDEVTIKVHVTRAKGGQPSQHSRVSNADNLLGNDADLAKIVLKDLGVAVTKDEMTELENQLTNNAAAFAAYLQGMSILTAPVRAVDNVEGAKSFETAVTVDPFFAVAWAKLAQCRAQMYSREAPDREAQANNARVALETASRLAPGAAETMLALGYFQFRVLGDYSASTATLERSRKVSSTSDIPVALAIIERQAGNWDKCISRLQELSKADPCHFEMLREAGRTNMGLRRFRVALDLFDQCLKLSPKSDPVLVQKTQLYQSTGDLQAAESVLDLLPLDFENEGIVQVHFDQAWLRRDFKKATKMMEDISKQMSTDSKWWGGLAETKYKMLLGVAEKHSGEGYASIDLSSALGRLLGFQRTHPGNAEYARLISQVYVSLGKKEDAIEAATRALKIAAKWNDQYDGPVYEINLASVQAQVGENDQAISALEHLLKVPANRFPSLTRETLFIDPVWDALRGSRRFQELCLGKSNEETKR